MSTLHEKTKTEHVKKSTVNMFKCALPLPQQTQRH